MKYLIGLVLALGLTTANAHPLYQTYCQDYQTDTHDNQLLNGLIGAGIGDTVSDGDGDATLIGFLLGITYEQPSRHCWDEKVEHRHSHHNWRY